MRVDHDPRVTRLLVWFICLMTLLGCARPWHRKTFAPIDDTLVMDQLVIHSDARPPPNHRLPQDLVRQRDDLAQTLALPTSDEPIHVFLFESPEKFDQFVARTFPDFPNRRALFVETDTQLAVYAQWGDRVAEDLRHEVAHGYLHAVVPRIPLWIDEGLAEYFEVPRGHNGLNKPHVTELASQMADNHWKPDLRRLEQFTNINQMSQLEYAEAWAWVHFMLQTDPRRRELLQNYLHRLYKEGTVEPLSLTIRRLHGQPEQLLIEHILALYDAPKSP